MAIVQNFTTAKISVDYLVFKIQTDCLQALEAVAERLFMDYNCNVKIVDIKNPTENHYMQYNRRNWCTSEFRINSNKFWRGTLVVFTGKHGQAFYNKLVHGYAVGRSFDYEKAVLSRLDLCFDRPIDESDSPHLVREFFEKACLKINTKYKRPKAKFEEEILRSGFRGSGRYYRSYRRDNGVEIRFELELKKKAAQRYQGYFITGQFEELEAILVKQFYKYSTKNLDMDSQYTDWLRDATRKMSGRTASNPHLFTTYLNTLYAPKIVDEEFLLTFFQLLSFLRFYECEVQKLAGCKYHHVSFPAREFLIYQGRGESGQHHLEKLKVFLKKLQTLPTIETVFPDASFSSAVVFPVVKIRRSRGIIIELAMFHGLADYSFPFLFPVEFVQHASSNEMKVQFFVLSAISTGDPWKYLYVEDFFCTFNLANQEKTTLRRYLIKLLKRLKSYKMIRPGFQIISKTGITTEKRELTPNLVSRASVIMCREVLLFET